MSSGLFCEVERLSLTLCVERWSLFVVQEWLRRRYRAPQDLLALLELPGPQASTDHPDLLEVARSDHRDLQEEMDRLDHQVCPFHPVKLWLILPRVVGNMI